MLDNCLRDKVTNQELRRRSRMEDATIKTRKTKWIWGGHVGRVHMDRWAYAMTVGVPIQGKRNRGHPWQ